MGTADAAASYGLDPSKKHSVISGSYCLIINEIVQAKETLVYFFFSLKWLKSI